MRAQVKIGLAKFTRLAWLNAEPRPPHDKRINTQPRPVRRLAARLNSQIGNFQIR
jgi:hypothetical protein